MSDDGRWELGGGGLVYFPCHVVVNDWWLTTHASLVQLVRKRLKGGDPVDCE